MLVAENAGALAGVWCWRLWYCSYGVFGINVPSGSSNSSSMDAAACGSGVVA
jgi:hypothetical protein